MRVVHIISGLRNGGAEAILFRLVTNDPENQHTVVSMMNEGYYGARLRDCNVDLVTLQMPPGKLTAKGLFQLWRALRRLRPQVVQTWMYHADLAGGIVARLAGNNAVVWGLHHTTLDVQRTPRAIRLLARACAFASRFVPSRIISCSDEGVVVHRRLGYSSEKLVTVNNGYDVNEFSPSLEARERTRSNLAVTKDTVLLGMVGRWHEQKDHENLLLALQLLKTATDKSWHCIMVGPGVDEKNDVLLSSRKNKYLTDHVRFLGPTDDVPALMNALDIHVLSSAFGEAFPNVIAEAMACGTPCITTDVGDAALMVGTMGWSVPPSDPDALQAALTTAIDAMTDTTSWNSLQVEAVARVTSHFALPGMVAAYSRVWNEAIRQA